MAFLDLNLFEKQFVTLNSNVLIVIFSNFHFLLFYLTRITKLLESEDNNKNYPHHLLGFWGFGVLGFVFLSRCAVAA